MGVRGLYSFIHGKDEYFEDFALESCHAVLDGNNLRFVLFKTTPGMNCAYGGDYAKYYNHVKAFCEDLKSCDVSATMVMDGAYDPSNVKRRTVLKRAREQARNAVECTVANQKSCPVLPLFAKDVFLQAVRDSGLTLVQTDFEADSYMAQLAVSLGCPVISNDSDFFVYGADFIPLSSLSSIVSVASDGRKSLSCRKFKRDAFLGDYGITDRRMLFLLSSVLGNDYVPTSAFEHFFAQMKKPKSSRLSDRHKLVTGMLRWISRESSVDAAVERILSKIASSERDRLRTKIQQSMSAYEEVTFSPSAPETSSLPEWFTSAFRDCKLQSWLLDVAQNGAFFLPSQVEAREDISSHLFALKLIAETCGLVKSLGLPGSTRSDVTLFTRAGPTCKPVSVTPSDSSKTLDELRHSTHEEKAVYISSQFGLPSGDRGTKSELDVFFHSLYFWTSSGNIGASELKTLSFVIFCGILDQSVEAESLGQEVTDAVAALSGDDRQVASEKATQYRRTNPQTLSNPKKFTLECVHSFSRLQAVLYHTTVLWSMIGVDPVPIPVHKLWHGTLLFNVYQDLSNYSDVDNRLQAIFDFRPALWNMFVAVFARLMKSTSKVNLASNNSSGAGKSRRIKKDKKVNLELKELENRFVLLATQ